jgi:molecular chaperone DnaJ
MPAAKRDYYEVLAVARDATAQEIKSAYRKLAVRWHPDKNPGDGEAEARFKEAAEAYAVLSDPAKRERYDHFGHAGLGGAGAGGAGWGGFDPAIFADFSDILGDLFGFGGPRRRGGGARAPRRGADLRYDLALAFEVAAFGTRETLRVPRLEGCPDCSGSGAAGGAAPRPCAACGGQGQVRYTQGFFTVARTCPQCQGEGVVVDKPCPGCRGEGLVQRERSIEVTIPPGVDTGARLRLPGEGEHGRFGGPPGDLYIVLGVQPHPRFEREGPHVWSRLAVAYPQAVLGAQLAVETLHGEVPLDLPAGTQHGQEFRLRGKGIDRLDRSGRGDHVVRVEVEVPAPRQLSERELELLRELAEASGKPVREETGVFEKVRKMFG